MPVSNSDPYGFWRAAIAGTPHEDFANWETPRSGYYRSKNMDKTWSPVAVWYVNDGQPIKTWHEWPNGQPMPAVNGTLCMKIGKNMASAEEAMSRWMFMLANPISYELYKSISDGGKWPDMDETVQRQVESGAFTSDKRNRENVAGVDDAAILKDEIETGKRGIEAYKTITSDEQLAKAQSLRSRLLELAGVAKKTHKKEKAPHLDAGKKVDNLWLPLEREAQSGADQLRALMKVWENKKLDEENAAAEERRKVEQKAAESGTPPPAPEPVAAPKMAAPIRGAYGRAASVQMVKVVKGITDQAKLYEYMKDRPEVIEVLFDLAKRAVKAGHDVPGVEVKEERDIR